MNNDRGLLSGSITILIGAVIAIMALVRRPWQIWLLLGVFTIWGLWVVLILLLPYMQQAQRRRQRQQRTRQLHAEGIQTRSFEIPDLGGTNSDDLLVRHTNHRILADQLLRLLFTPLEGGLRISGAQICQNTMVGVESSRSS